MRTLAVVLILIVATGCATKPKPRQIINEFEMQAPFDEVWTAVIETFSDRNLPIDNMEKDSGLITTDWLSFGFGDEHCDCGSAGIATDFDRVGRFNVFVKPTDSGTILKVNASFKVTRSFGNNSWMVECLSTGLLEAEIEESVGTLCGLKRIE